MGTYAGARAKTKASIEAAFWKLYTEKGLRKVTVQETAELAGIHRATFYMYYDSIGLVLDSIKDRQLALLVEVLRPPRARKNDYSEFLSSLQRYFDENRNYLEPLVCAYQDNEFALRYRGILKEELRKDLAFPLFPEGTREGFMIDTILSAFIETLLQTLRTKALPLRDSYRLVSGSVEKGISSTLQRDFQMDIPC